MRHWLKRVEASRIRQRLRKDALTKIRQLQTQVFVDVDKVLASPNRSLASWIQFTFDPASALQPTLHTFFSPLINQVSTPF